MTPGRAGDQVSLDLNGASAVAARDHASGAPLTRDDVMTVPEVAALLHMPTSSVYALARRGEIPGHRIGRCWRFIRTELDAWLRAA